jgi:hypothetical protein
MGILEPDFKVKNKAIALDRNGDIQTNCTEKNELADYFPVAPLSAGNDLLQQSLLDQTQLEHRRLINFYAGHVINLRIETRIAIVDETVEPEDRDQIQQQKQ